MFGDERPELADQLRANVSRFSAYKAAYVRRELDSVAADGTMTEEERKAMTKATISQFSRWTDAEMTTATARARTAKQFSEYNDPDRKELFPCLRWLPSRSAVPRSTHRRFYDRVWRKDDNFWKTNQPGTEWNCKCDIEETDDPATDNSDIEQPPVPKGLEGNPASTGEVFTDNASYIRSAGEDTWKEVKPAVRSSIRQKHEGYKETIETKIGNILIDEITMIETSKGSATDKSYFIKQEIARNFNEYIDRLRFLYSEDVDLSHNNKNNMFYKRKKRFKTQGGMKAYNLLINDIEFVVKLGVFKDREDSYHLYSITG